MPVVSVCVVTYNQVAWIERCLRSILDQQVDADVRVLVGDDGSNDGTGAVINALAEEYGSRLQCVMREKNLGAFDNLRDLLERARGDFVARVDGDDYWLPGKLARQLDYLSIHEDCVAVYTNALLVDDADSVFGVFNDLGDTRLGLADLVRRGNLLNNSSVLFRSCCLPGWTKRGDQIDYEVHLWQARMGLLGHIGEPLAAYRVSSRGSLVTASWRRVSELYWQAIQSVPRDAVPDADYVRGITDFLRRAFFRSVRARSPRFFLGWARRVLAASPFGPVRTAAMFLANVVEASWKIAVAGFAGRQGRRVLYRK